MKRFHATPSGPVPFTPEEEAARDAEEAAGKEPEDDDIADIRDVLRTDRSLTPGQLNRVLQHLLARTGG